MKLKLTRGRLRKAAQEFSVIESSHDEPKLYGVTDGKAIGTYLEHKFNDYLSARFDYSVGNSAKGIDFPKLGIDIKVTSIKQPQSSCPYKSARQKIFGLGYALLIFIYEKSDNDETRTGRLDIRHTIFVSAENTADFQTTTGILRILENDGNKDDLLAFLEERMLPADSIEAERIVDEILNTPPAVGYLTISNALQWRLQYRRVIDIAGDVEGVIRVF
ncbi:MAG: hypothetical protein P9L94_12555 [Candidatus Hinthialibacter antarcticus]|nr:hypothetical protein [Candidatus Hinthialibacter antarcticus]